MIDSARKILPEDGVDLVRFLQGMERQLMIEALIRTYGHQERAAALLQISVRELRHRLDKYEMRAWAADLRCRRPCCARGANGG